VAAQGGHLALLKWVRANACVWDREMCLALARVGSEIHKWVEAQPA
jgi:hypothetical protein